MLRIASTDELNFVTLTVVDWIGVFARRQCNNFITENLARGRQHKNLNKYTHVPIATGITNHINMVANITDGSRGDILNQFQSYTLKKPI